MKSLGGGGGCGEPACPRPPWAAEPCRTAWTATFSAAVTQQHKQEPLTLLCLSLAQHMQVCTCYRGLTWNLLCVRPQPKGDTAGTGQSGLGPDSI